MGVQLAPPSSLRNAPAADIAQTQAGNAASSATAAGNSATAAGDSATAAGNSATAAGNSATAAGDSATAAGNSQTAAAASETNAANAAQAAQDVVDNLTVSAVTLAEGQNAAANYDPGTGNIEFGIPRGDTGAPGSGSIPDRLSEFCESVTDWDDATSTGFFKGEDAANAPGESWWIGRVVAHAPTFVTQELHGFTQDVASDSFVFRRDLTGGSWSGWRKV